MFKDKVKVTVVALVMVLLMVLSITTDLFVGLADVFRAKAEEATPTDATPVTRDVTVYKELNDSDKDRNLAGAVIKVFKDSACTESITEFVLSYDGKSYGGDDRVVYKNLEERVNANASKAIAKLQEDTYYYQLDEKLFRSNDDYNKTGYDYNNTVSSFSIVAGDGVQEIKLDNNMFRPTEKVATPTDASSEVSTEVTTEAITEPDTQVATTSDASSEETETTTQVATPTDSIPEVKPVATLASVFRTAVADVYVWGTETQGCGNYHKTSSSANSANMSLDGDIGSRMFCVDWGANGPSLANGYTRPVKYSRGGGADVSLRKVVAYYYEVLAKTSGNLAATEHYLSLLNHKKGTTPIWASAAMKYTALASGEETINIDKTKPSMTYYKSYSFKANGEVFHTSTNVFVSEPVTVTAEKSEQYFTASVPKDCAVYVYNYNSETKKYQWTRYGSTDNLKLKNGDKFRIVLPKSFANKTVSLSGTARYGGWDVYYYNPNDPAWLDCQQMVLATETDKPEFSLSVKTGNVPPDHDPVNVEIRKIDSVSGKAVPAGTAALAGAVFKMEYFKGKDSVSGSATNTWYLQTAYDSSIKGYVAKFARGYLYSDSTHKSDAAPAEVDASGVYELEAGCMRITEVIAPSGYEKVTADNAGYVKLFGSTTKITDSASITVKISAGNVTYGNTAVKDGVVEIGEQKERYDFKLKKVDSYGNPMAGVAFLVTASNGDQHVVVTDKNGEFDSSKLGYTNVNGNDATLAKAMADTTLYPTYKETNVFFTTPGSGKTAAAEIKEETVDGKAPRPLYKDTYTIREIHRQYVTIDGKKYKLTQVYDLGPAQKITVSDSVKNGAVIDFGTYTNTAIPKMTSSAISTDTNTKMSVAGKNASFKDSIKATNLKASTKYTLMSVAVDANTGKAYKDADGKYVAKNVAVTTGAVKKGTVFPETTASVTFTGVNTSNVKSRKLVFYEYLVEGSVTKTVSLDSAGKPVEPANCVAKDASVSNKAQTVNVISLETKVLVDSTKTNVAPADEKVDVTDTVTLHNLVAGTKFTLVGKVSDGENIKVENEVEFTAKGDDETVSVPLKGLNLTEYAGKSLYVICELKYDGEVIATHNEDGTDPDEKFYVPAVETNAIDATTNTQYSILDKTQIIDSVKYSNLPTEYEYELETTFVDSATGEEIKKTEIEKDPYWNMLKDLGYVTDETSSDSTGDSVAEDTGKIVSEVGKAFKRTQVLKPEKMDDTVNVTFDIDPRSFNLEGKTITIRQVIKLNGVAVAKHTDKDAESQQISFPTGSTLAVDNTSHNHTIAPTKDADVVDTIFCKNLATGISVDFYGIAIDKDTNKPVELNGKGMKCVVIPKLLMRASRFTILS